jgi:hypothetical protein
VFWRRLLVAEREGLHFPGIDCVGPLPADIQQYATFSSGIIAGAGQTNAAKTVVEFLTSLAAAPIF